MRAFLRNLVEDIATLVDETGEGGSTLRRWIARTIRFCSFGMQQLAQDRAPQMAAALAYRTIFSIIPVLVVSLVVLGSFYGPNSIEEPLNRMLDFSGVGNLTLSAGGPAEGETSGAEPATGEAAVPGAQGGDASIDEEHQTVADWISDLVIRVQSLNFAAIGAVGAIILVYAAFSLLFEIERAFNIVYVAERGRRTMVRLTKYWALLTLGPLLLIASFYVGQRLTNATPFAGLRGLSAVTTFIISWLLLAMVYTLGPNARVAKRPAMIGAFVAGLLWELAKWGFAKYLTLATGYTAFYGSLGLLPVFLLWIYLTWLIILFGLELSYVAQMFPHLDTTKSSRQARAGSVAEPALAVVILKVIAAGFEKGEVTTESQLLERTGAAPGIIQSFTRKLVSEGLLRVVADQDESALTLAMPAESISLDQALRIGLSITANVDGQRAGTGALLTRIHDAQTAAIGNLTLADLSNDDEPGAADQ